MYLILLTTSIAVFFFKYFNFVKKIQSDLYFFIHNAYLSQVPE